MASCYPPKRGAKVILFFSKRKSYRHFREKAYIRLYNVIFMQQLRLRAPLLFACFWFFTVQGQTQWQMYGPQAKTEEAQDLCRAPSGSLYLLSSLDTNLWSGGDYGIYKLDSTGKQIWKRPYGQNGKVSAKAILFHQGHLYVAGGLDLNGKKQAFLSKIDSSGRLLWQRQYGRGDTLLQFLSMDSWPSGDLALLAQYGPDSTKAAAAMIARLDTGGQLIWRYFSQDSVDLVPHDLAVNDSGAVYIVADYERPNRFDLLVYHLNASGQFQAKKIISNGYTRGGNAIDINPKGQIAIGGEGATGLSVYFDITLSLLDQNLNLIRDVFVRPGVVKNDAAFGMTASAQGTYLFTGYRIEPENGTTEMIVVESDAQGQVLRQHNFCNNSTCIGARIISAGQQFWAIGNDFSAAPNLILARGINAGLALPPRSSTKISLYPQPNKGRFVLSQDPRGPVELTDAMGRRQTFHQHGRHFDAAHLPPGYYWLHLPSEGLHLPVVIE